ncbi:MULTISPECIES: GNAT family N-acetyltransferase [Flavobacteriaceae]|uniref:GNAT family N-acetyltransferase n=1 Tax=Flavobacteriaceae TaxID=49546 RepID=UPI001491C1F1|nr:MULTISPECIES: GNAT family N-acetyltransferase [Allomuricauda]MDC6366371.1 GNAT family N-acetyltransferase [Muricauda sp. AC10]
MDKGFKIEYLNPNDAKSLNLLMVSNVDIFNRFFPKTMEQNLRIYDSKKYILKKSEEIKSKTEFTFAIKESKNSLVAGLVILKDLDWNDGKGEIAYCLGKKYQGKGWATASVEQVSEFAFHKLGLNILKIVVHKTNRASIGVAEKCGYTWKNTIPKAYHPPNEKPLDMERYILTNEK